MGQGGNIDEWSETALDGTNDSTTENRIILGGSYITSTSNMRSVSRSSFFAPSVSGIDIGFRVASVPEPSTYALLAMSAAGALWWARRRR